MESIEKLNCEICYKIKCLGCGWEASDAEVLLVQKKELTSCPLCGWSPNKSANFDVSA